MKKLTRDKLRAKMKAVRTGKTPPGEILRQVTNKNGEKQIEHAPGQNRAKR